MNVLSRPAMAQLTHQPSPPPASARDQESGRQSELSQQFRYVKHAKVLNSERNAWFAWLASDAHNRSSLEKHLTPENIGFEGVSLRVEMTTTAQNASSWVRRRSEAQKNRQDARKTRKT